MTVMLDGNPWKPLPGTTATAEEFIAARSVLQEIHSLMRWSPWVLEDRAPEYGAALEVSGQWIRADPGFEPETAEELEAEVEQRFAQAEAQAIADHTTPAT